MFILLCPLRIFRWLYGQISRLNGKPTSKAKTAKKLTSEQIIEA